VNLVQRLGGTFEIRSEVGVGTMVRFTLPRARPAAQAPAVAPAVSAARPARVLVIDDDVNVTRALQRMLKKHDTVVARSGVEALALLRRDDAFDLVLCDVMMPELTGVDVYRTLAEENPALASRVVLMSAGAFAKGVSEFMATFPGGVLEKPFAAEALHGLVAAAARRATKSA
jgi:DNA-binding NtrC family response regulator